MGCLFAVIGGLAPRFAFFIFWIMRPTQVDAAFDTWIFPLLGIIFLPLATLLYAVLWTVGGLSGWAWFWVILAAFLDIAHSAAAPEPPGALGRRCSRPTASRGFVAPRPGSLGSAAHERTPSTRGSAMAWDFSTEPEFQKKLDWVEEFCREEVEPLEYVFPYAVRSQDPKIRALVKGLQDQVKDQGLWAIFLDEELGGPGYGQLKLGLLNEILGRYPSAPQMFGAAAPDTGNMEMLAAYGTDEQKERWLEPMLNQEMWSAYSMTEPQGGSDPNLFKTHADARRRRVGHQRREVVHERRPGRRHPLRDVHERHVRRAPRRRPASRSSPSRATTTTSSTTTCASRSTTCSARRTAPRCSPSGASAAVASTTRCAPSPSASSPST